MSCFPVFGHGSCQERQEEDRCGKIRNKFHLVPALLCSVYCCSTRLASSYSLIISLLTELGLLAWKKKNWAFSDIACSDSISEICLCLMISSHIYTLHSPLLSGLFILPQLNTIAVTCTCIIYFVSLAIEMVSEGKKTHTEFSHLLANRSRTTVISKPFGIPYYLEGSSSR